MDDKIWRIDIQDAIDWEIGEGTLRQALVDEAESVLGLTHNDDIVGVVSVEGLEFVVKFDDLTTN